MVVMTAMCLDDKETDSSQDKANGKPKNRIDRTEEWKNKGTEKDYKHTHMHTRTQHTLIAADWKTTQTHDVKHKRKQKVILGERKQSLACRLEHTGNAGRYGDTWSCCAKEQSKQSQLTHTAAGWEER